MGPQARLEGCPHPAPAKERFMSGSGSPGRLQDNLSRDSGVGGLKVSDRRIVPSGLVTRTSTFIMPKISLKVMI